jgi:hypothetical protein
VVQQGSDQGITQQQQQQQQQQQLAADCDSWLDDQGEATSGVEASGPADAATAGTSTSMQVHAALPSCCATLGEPSTPAAAAAGSFDPSSCSSSSSTTGDILFDFTFSLHALQPVNPADLQPPSGGLTPTDPSLKPNRLVLQLGDSLYTLPPPAPKPQTDSELEGLEVGEDGEYEWVGEDGDKVMMSSSSSLLFPGYRSSLNPQGLPGLRRQLSTGHKQLPSVTKHQQLFR